ncbi:class I SAM-dependent methyltransferase [Rosistilla oblonga]|uniref:class I SAM-dependent methyltransferase n=1 Tax=Rosistilla oblonga TaxID=2527990 RepID=UPI003A9727E9
MSELTFAECSAAGLNTKHAEHYQEEYFAWQKTVGEFGGWANLHKFQDYIRPTDRVVDFGCGGGFLLKQIECREKLGIDVNPVAAQNARELGIRAESSPADVPDSWADVIVSNHALEHARNPLAELEQLWRILKPGGKVVLVVPCETIRARYVADDINYHLFTWSPVNLGNLFSEAGFRVIESKPYMYKWPPFKRQIVKLFGRTGFNFFAGIRARLDRRDFQVRVVATK